MNDHAPVVTPHSHDVAFYDHESDLFAQVTRFVSDGIARGERIVCIPTRIHRDALDAALLQNPADADPAIGATQCLVIDAAEMLSEFLVAGMPDAARFTTAIGSLLDAASENGQRVRVFGEMVALLWDTGHPAAAAEVETLWNVLAVTKQFSLLCAYPTTALAQGSLTDATRVCELHSKIAPPRSYLTPIPGSSRSTHPAPTSATFLPVPAAVPAARRFVAAALSAWGAGDRLVDAVLVTSELATNAIVHAGSAFRVKLEPHAAGCQISVEDHDPTPPVLRETGLGDVSGRGLAILNERALRWGWDRRPDGKAVWAQLEPAW